MRTDLNKFYLKEKISDLHANELKEYVKNRPLKISDIPIIFAVVKRATVIAFGEELYDTQIISILNFFRLLEK